jgi:tetratricopeptide (TPR) repeat protein
VKKDISNLDKMVDDAEFLLENGKLRRAERLLKKMLANDPNCISAHFNLARVYIDTKEYDLALRHARRTLKLNPTETNACLNLGVVYDLMERDNLAISYYKRELSRNPGNEVTLWNIGRLYYEKHRWHQASQNLRHCIEVGYLYKDGDTMMKLGFCYYKLRDNQSYIDAYRRYLLLVPRASWAAVNLGYALMRAKDYRSAALWLTRAIQLGAGKDAGAELVRARKMLLKSSTH